MWSSLLRGECNFKKKERKKAKSVPKVGDVDALAWILSSQEAVAQDRKQLEGILGYSQFKQNLK